MNTQTITVAQARSDFSNLLAQADLLDHRFVIARRGKPKAALVSVRDLARLEALERAGASVFPRSRPGDRGLAAGWHVAAGER